MTPAGPDEDTGEAVHSVVAGLGGAMEFEGTIRADSPLPSEHLTRIRADFSTQIAWLDAIEEALREVRRHLRDTAALVEAAAVAERLRAELTSPRPRAVVARTLWLTLHGSIAAPLLLYYGKTVGTELGHATAHKIIEVLTNLSHYLNP